MITHNTRSRMAIAAGILAFAGGASTASAGLSLGGPMSHLLVSVFNQQVFLSFESPSLSVVEMQMGSNLTGAAAVLNGTGYNAQFGWLANGFVSIPPGSGVFVRELSSSPWLDVYAESGFDPILGTDGSDAVWQWDGTMTHNWYSTRVQGTHRAEYEVFVGDLAGNPLDGWGSATISLAWSFGEGLSGVGAGPRRDATGAVLGSVFGAGVGVVPSPGAPAMFGIGALACIRRRR